MVSGSTSASGAFTAVTLNPAFVSATEEYSAPVGHTISHVKLTPTVSDPGATVEVGPAVAPTLSTVTSGQASAAWPLEIPGAQTVVKVKVTAEDGSTTKTYTVDVPRYFAAPTDLAVTPGTDRLELSWTAPSYGPNGYDVHYTSANAATVANNAAASGNNPATAWVAVSRTETKPLSSSQTISSLTDTTTYRVRVRAKVVSDTILGAWVFGAGTPDTANDTTLTVLGSASADGTFTALTLAPATFAASTTDYAASVANTVTHVKLTPTASATGSTVRVGQQGKTLATATSASASAAIPLSGGQNVLLVRVTSANGNVNKDYIVTVMRAATFNPFLAASGPEGSMLNIRVQLSDPAPSGGVEFTLMPLYGEDAVDGARLCTSTDRKADANDLTNPPTTLTVPAGQTEAGVGFPLADDGGLDTSECFAIRTTTSASGWTAATRQASDPPAGMTRVIIEPRHVPLFSPTTAGTGGGGDSASDDALPDLEPSFGSTSVPDQSYTEGVEITPLVLPAATGGNGPLTYALTPSLPDGLTLDLSTRRLSGTPTTPQDGRQYTWTATDADGDEATLTFAVAIAVDPHRQRVREASRRALAEMARRSMSGALDTIGARFGAVGVSGLSLAGQPVSLESGASVADGVGMAVWNNQSLALGELLGESALSLRLGAAGNEDSGDVNLEEEGPLWSVWGRGDLASFAGGREEETHYDGWLRSGWLGLDARSGRWVAGMALSHEQGQADYGATMAASDRPLQGRLETSLTALYPYGRWTLANGLELQGVVGVGWGEARHTPADEQRETGTLSMRMASLGVRKSLPDVAGLALALRADAAVTRIETGNGPDTIHNLSADSWRLRTGLEASRRFSLEGEAFLEPFLEAAARQDGGDGLEGSGVELAGGLRYSAPSVAVELRGRWLAAHSEKGAEEQGVSLTARYGPGADGQGLFFALSPRWGAATGGAQALWGEDLPVLSTASAGNSGAVDAQMGYGFVLHKGGVLTPFAEVGMAGSDSRRLRLGTRYAAAVTGLEMAVELAGERRESGDAAAEHALQLDVDLRF